MQSFPYPLRRILSNRRAASTENHSMNLSVFRSTLFLLTLSLLFAASALLNSAAFAQNKKAKRPRPKRQTSVGATLGDNKATPVDRVRAAKGFKVELLYSVP